MGTTVSLWLPLVRDDNNVEYVDDMLAFGTEHVVLLIDDEPLVRQSVRLLLEKLGWYVASCANRQEAESVVARRLTDIKVVVCDIRLGEDNGFDVIDALQEQGMTVPVLYITGYASSLDQQLEQNENLLVKPFQSEQLGAALDALLESENI